MNLAQIITDRLAIWTAVNNAGDGIRPPAPSRRGRCVYSPATDDDVAVYATRGGRSALLVADAHGPWAVRVEVSS